VVTRPFDESPIEPVPAQLLSNAEVRSAVPMRAAIDALRVAFLDLARDGFTAPISAEYDGGLMIKSVYHAASNTSVIKTLSFNPDRPPLVTGVVTLLDHEARSQLVAEAESVTAIRTGAIVGLATDLLADPQARTMVLIGAGAQALDQVRAVAAVRNIDRLTIVDREPQRADALRNVVQDLLPQMRCQPTTDARAAVADCDIVCCVTSAISPLFEAADLPERVHVNAIGSFRPSMRELPRELLADATVVVDRRAAALAEAGEIIDAVRAGVLAEPDILELGVMLTEHPRARERTVFKTVGLAVQDWALMSVLATLYAESGVV
jgi:ornithine cyclodeaminase/alanine dehydrogenase-like protein (mu-crystallin family)